ncbi:MAG: DinB family protein [Pseudomonadota bacterium]
MNEPSFVRRMAQYNLWQNRLLHERADAVSEAARRKDLNMCFGSVHNLFSHMLWDDMMVMHALAGTARPKRGTVRSSVLMEADWPGLRAEHEAFAGRICEWAEGVTPLWLAGVTLWRSGTAEREAIRPRSMLVVQLFNHQTHHRGQLHVMLSQLGAKTPHTDLCFLPEPEEAG